MDDPRPQIPKLPPNEEYGTPSSSLDVPEREPWSGVSRRIGAAVFYWLATTRPDGRPHCVPIGAVWYENRLYFDTSPRTVTARNLAGNQKVCVHLESGTEVVIVEGHAVVLTPDAVPVRVLDEYASKYSAEGHRPDPRDPELPWYAIAPSRVLFWVAPDVRNTAVRWQF